MLDVLGVGSAEAGRLVALVSTSDEGVPRAGVVKVGLLLNTVEPEPVLVVTPVPPDETPSVPARVTAPVVDVAGVSPERLVWKEVTPVFAGVAQQIGRAHV